MKNQEFQISSVEKDHDSGRSSLPIFAMMSHYVISPLLNIKILNCSEYFTPLCEKPIRHRNLLTSYST